MDEMKNIVDTHAHLDDERFSGDIANVLQRFESVGGLFLINNSSDIKGLVKGIRLANEYPQIFCTLGAHPYEALNYITDEFEKHIFANADNSKVVAIGEIGLDYHRPDSPREAQKEIFVRQLQIANELKLPVTLHSRDSYQDLLDITAKHSALIQNGGVVHCFSSSAEVAEQLLKRGFYISFTGTITFSNSRQGEFIAKSIPIDKILCETDCPYLAPTKYRGKRNEPSYVVEIIDKLSQIYEVSYQQMAQQLLKNTLKLFTKISQVSY